MFRPVFRTSQIRVCENLSATWVFDTTRALRTHLLSKMAFFKLSRGAGSRRSAECKLDDGFNAIVKIELDWY